MKDVEKNINKEIDQILLSGSGNKRVDTSPFFTTRVIGKVEQLEENIVWFPRLSMVLKPVLVVLVIFNLVNFLMYNQSSSSETEINESFELAANDYKVWSNDFVLSEDMYWESESMDFN